jgi:hypothetical protein
MRKASLIFIRVNPCPSVAKFVSAKMGSARFLGAFKIPGDIRSPETHLDPLEEASRSAEKSLGAAD